MLVDWIRNSFFYREIIRPRREKVGQYSAWRQRDYADQSPEMIKRSVLRRNSTLGGTWVETGTYIGESTAFLALDAGKVYTIEPEKGYFERASQRFSKTDNVTVINGTSESVLPGLLAELKGDINFWLDGHYSAGGTFKGAIDCPVEEELRAIKSNLTNYSKVSILIDDVRCFLPRNEIYPDYPSIDLLVNWARKKQIFLARRTRHIRCTKLLNRQM